MDMDGMLRTNLALTDAARLMRCELTCGRERDVMAVMCWCSCLIREEVSAGGDCRLRA